MSDAKWTPGPWEYVELADDFDNACGVGMGTYLENPGAYTCIHLWECKEGAEDDEAIANAHLIAAAPDLFAELEEAREVIQALIDEGYTGFVGQRECIDRVLSKARGEQ